MPFSSLEAAARALLPFHALDAGGDGVGALRTFMSRSDVTLVLADVRHAHSGERGPLAARRGRAPSYRRLADARRAASDEKRSHEAN